HRIQTYPPDTECVRTFFAFLPTLRFFEESRAGGLRTKQIGSCRLRTGAPSRLDGEWRQPRSWPGRLERTRSQLLPLTISPGSPSYAVLSAMITPAIFLTANGSLIISTSNRMSRVVDRIRVLNDLGDRLCRGGADFDFSRERLEHVQAQLNRLVWRGDRIR